ncbi:MAG: ankyrin repeat domain-containing protein [Verrucomicrobiota bacterium]
MKKFIYAGLLIVIFESIFLVKYLHCFRLGELYWLLDRACYMADETSVKILLKANADPTGVMGYDDFHKNIDKTGIEFDSPLRQAAENGSLQIVKMLLEKGGNPNIASGENYTPLIYAVKNNHMEIVKLLLEKGADKNHKSDEGSALEIAERNQNLEIIRLLQSK